MSSALNASCMDYAERAVVVFWWVVTKSGFQVTKLKCGGCSHSIGSRYALAPGCGSETGGKGAGDVNFDQVPSGLASQDCCCWIRRFVLALLAIFGSVFANVITCSIAFAAS